MLANFLRFHILFAMYNFQDIIQFPANFRVAETTFRRQTVAQKLTAATRPFVPHSTPQWKPPVTQQLVFVDEAVSDASTLVDGVSPDVSVFFLDLHQDGIEQITDILRSRTTPVHAIHIVSHGYSGAIQLGNSILRTYATTLYIAQQKSGDPNGLTRRSPVKSSE